MKRSLLFLLAGLLLLSGCSSRNRVTDGPGMLNSYRQISQDEAMLMMLREDGHVVVDVRTKEEYDAGHIPGAILIPNEDIGSEPPKELPDRNQIILIYCRSGNRSKQAAQKLFDMGYTNVFEFGGINTWTGEIRTEEPAAKEIPLPAGIPAAVRYDRMWAYGASAEITDPALIGEVLDAVRALKVAGPTNVCVDDYTDVLTFTYADGTVARLEFEDQNWVTDGGERLLVEGMPRLRELLDGVLADRSGGAVAGRRDGERYETVIVLEGMEETVGYEHVRNETLGFEMDYDYGSFLRQSGPDRERFVSVWDDPENPENYLDVTRSAQDAETAAAAVCGALSAEYELIRESPVLSLAGACIRIDASEVKGGGTMPAHLQMVYIIPAADGCRIATAHYAIEGAEGFGRRFHYFMETFAVLPG